MGIEYTLANHENKTCFELGKGSWYALCDHNGKGDVCLLYEDQIYDVIINEIWEYNIATSLSTKEKSDWIEYSKTLSKEIFKFINNVDPSRISLTNDSDDSTFELRQNGYRWVGSRYVEDDLSLLNRHIK